MDFDDPQESVAKQPAGLKISDIYFVLFRHKKKILLFFLMGLAAAVYLFFTEPPIYKSRAKVLVRYIYENKSVGPSDDASQVKTPDSRGDNILNSEVEILTSLDLARNVAQLIGPERILGQTDSTNELIAAAVNVRSGITVDVPRKSSVIIVNFSHPNINIITNVLSALLREYQSKHVEIHRTPGTLQNFLQTQTDGLRAKLAATDSELRQKLSEVGILSLQDAKISLNAELTKINEELFLARAQLAQHNAILGNDTTATNTAANPTTNTLMEAVNLPPEDVIKRYRELLSRIETVQEKERDALTTMTEENVYVKSLKAQVADLETRQAEMQTEFPALRQVTAAPKNANRSGQDDGLAGAINTAKGLAAKIDFLTNQLAEIRRTIVRVETAEPEILQLQRRRNAEEQQYLSYEASKEQNRINSAMGLEEVPNIPVVQAPSPPTRDMASLIKRIAAALGGGLVAGLGLAFLMEFVLDPSVKRASDIKEKLRVPTFMALPRKSGRAWKRTKAADRQRGLGKESNISYGDVVWKGGSGREPAPWDPDHPLREQFEAIRDRLVADFEIRDVVHKPKLVALTSCNRGAGVSTIAAGLAAALSDVGNSKVLLVDLHSKNGQAHPILSGQPISGIPEMLESENRGSGHVSQNLYLASAERQESAVRDIMPRKLSHLLPKMKASDYDYIIFDMPKVSQANVTARLAGMMDITFLVVESEKTHRDLVKQAFELLTECNGKVTSILNKEKKYIPSWVHQEL